MSAKAKEQGATLTSGMKDSSEAVSRLGIAAGAAKGLLIGMFAAASAAAIAYVTHIVENIEKMREMQDLAKALSVSTRDIKALDKAASIYGIDTKQLNQDMLQFAGNLRKASVVGGKLADFMSANNIKIKDAAGNMRPVQQVFADVAKLIRESGNELDKLAAVKKIGFDPEVLRLIERGEGAIKVFGQAAVSTQDDTNKVLIAKYEELRMAWDKFMKSMTDGAVEMAHSVLSSIGNMLLSIRDGFSETVSSIRAQISTLRGDTAAAAGHMNDAQATRNAAMLRDLRSDANSGNAGYLGDLSGASKDLRDQADRPLTVNKRRKIKDLYKPQKTKEDTESKDAVERYIDQLNRANKLAEADAKTWMLSNVERAKAVALADAQARAEKDGVTLTEKQKNTVAELAANTQRLKDRTEELRNAADRMSETFADALDSLIVKGNSAKDVMKSLLQSIASAILKSALLGKGDFGGMFGGGGGAGGLLGGLFKGLFGGFKADGGPVMGGKAYVVGENGPELFAPQGGGTIIPNGGGGGSGGPQQMHVNVNLAGANGDATIQRMVMQGVQAGLAQFSTAVLPGRLNEIQMRGAA